MSAEHTYSKTILPIIRRVREMLLPHYGKVSFQDKLSGRIQDAVTTLDLRVEEFLKSEFARLHPDIAFVGEETGGNRSVTRFWLVDPIDGTTHFIRGMPFCTTMVALIEDGKTVFSAIYDFIADRMYSAEKGGGAFVNGEPLRVSNRPLARAYLAWETHLDNPENMRRFLRLREQCLLFKAGCSGYEFALVASGKLDGRLCFHPHGKDYDYVPGVFLVQEAGGRVANIGMRTYDYRNLEFIAANPLVFKELTEDPNAIFPIQS